MTIQFIMIFIRKISGVRPPSLQVTIEKNTSLSGFRGGLARKVRYPVPIVV